MGRREDNTRYRATEKGRASRARERERDATRRLESPDYLGGELKVWSRCVPAVNSCVIWTGATRNGYGCVRWQGWTQYTHRLVFQAIYGPVPDDQQIDHLCRTPLCSNHFHLDAVTPLVNVLRGESPAAKNARKTHCDYGHEFTEENTYWRTRNDGRKHRDCLTCMRIYVRPRGAKS